MEILFENRYSQDKQWAKAAYGYLLLCRPASIFGYVFFGCFLLLGICLSITTGVLEWPLLLMPFVWFGLMLLLYYRGVNATLKRAIEVHGKPIDVIITVTEEEIHYAQSTGSQFRLKYEDIKKVVVKKDYIYLISKAKLLYTFKKDAFTAGSAEGFLGFLIHKGIKRS